MSLDFRKKRGGMQILETSGGELHTLKPYMVSCELFKTSGGKFPIQPTIF